MKTRKLAFDEISKVIDPIIGMRNNDWYLVTATNSKGETNGLTVACGAFGNVCEKPTMTVYIRPQRYTKKFIDDSDTFT